MKIIETNWTTHHQCLTDIRYQVFVHEQGVPVEMELDEHDQTARHWLLQDSTGETTTYIATLRLLNDGSIGRMAVLSGYRGQGWGKALLQACIQTAKAEGIQELTLSSQCHALGFYEKLGFVPRGEVFMDAGIPHRQMFLALTK